MKISNILETSYSDINTLEKRIDKLFADVNIDVKFSKHFKQRIIERNISPNEIIETFVKLYRKYGRELNIDDYSALIYDIASHLNIPIKIEYDKKEKDFDLFSITILKTENKPKNPHSNDKILNV